MITYFKAEPSAHVMLFSNGRLKREGKGLSFFCSPGLSSVVLIPATSQDAPFALREVTSDHQEITIQGHLTYRIKDVRRAASALDFTVNPRTHAYRTDDHLKFEQRIVNALQSMARDFVRKLGLEEALGAAEEMTQLLHQQLNHESSLTGLGVVIESVHILHVTPAAETRKALEAEYRENLNRRADQAIYGRRKAALDEERTLRETELKTDIEIEDRRQELVATQAENQLTLARGEAEAEKLKLTPYGEIAPQALVALALNKWAESIKDIGQLNITPDLLTQLAGWMSRGESQTRQQAEDDDH